MEEEEKGEEHDGRGLLTNCGPIGGRGGLVRGQSRGVIEGWGEGVKVYVQSKIPASLWYKATKDIYAWLFILFSIKLGVKLAPK